VGCSKGGLKKEFYSHECPHQKTREISINNWVIHPKLLEKQEQNNPKSNRQKEITKISAEINELETKEYSA
jgi:hypothetical protein